MEHLNILFNFFVIMAVVLIATPDVAGGYQILNYDEDAPAYPWERVVYRERLPQLHKRGLDLNGRNMGDIFTPVNPVAEPNFNRTNKRISGFDESISDLKNVEKDFRISGIRVIYGRVSVPVIAVASYPKPMNLEDLKSTPDNS